MRDEIFTQLLARQWEQGRMACVGLDPDLDVVHTAAGPGSSRDAGGMSLACAPDLGAFGC